MAQVSANGIKIEYEEFGDLNATPVILISGFATQLIHWPDAFINKITTAGYRVICFDNRDIGLTTKFHNRIAPPLSIHAFLSYYYRFGCLAPYSLGDMANDCCELMRAMSIENAHIIGISMGGMIGQILCAKNPKKVRSFTAIMSSTNNPYLPQPSRKILNMVLHGRSAQLSRERLIQNSIDRWRAIGTPDGRHDTAEFRRAIETAIDRSHYPQGLHRQIAAIVASGDLRTWARRISAPSLVIHGSIDPLTPFTSGVDIAKNIHGAKFVLIEGMGHDLPPAFMAQIANTIVTHIASAG